MRNTLFTLAAVSALFTTSTTQAAELKDGLYAELNTTKGKILLSLEFEKTPQTVASFVGLAEGTKHYSKDGSPPKDQKGKPFYNGIIFHRVIPGFMIQFGCPLGRGNGGPGYNFADEFDPKLRHAGPGILSMANAGPGTNGSQFFITHRATPNLDNRHSVFGKVVQGQDVVVAIAAVKRYPNGHPSQNRPVQDIVMKSVKIIRNGEKAKAFKGDEAHYNKIIGEKEKAKTAKFADRMEKEAEQIEKRIADLKKKHKADVVTTKTGLRYIVLQKGTGNPPAKGALISAHYTGTLADGTKFDSSRDSGQPFKFPVGVGRVIPGWDEALSEMKKGEQRILIVPYKLGYGERGFPPVIPPFATLVFDVALVGF